MLIYLNRMSAKGLHLMRLGRFKNTFEDDKDKRYIYAICNTHTEDYYSEVGRWERVFEYKALAIYRKKVPKESVSIKKRNLQKKAMQEKLWLGEMLDEGLLLFGKVESEYIFERAGNVGKTEYFVDYIPPSKNSDEYLYEKALSGLECISPSTDGITYYFVKREGQDVVKGLKRLRSENAVMKRRMWWSLLALILITASFITTLIFAVKYNKLIIPCLISGGTLTAASFTVFMVFRGIFRHEKRRLDEEEERLNEFKNTEEGERKADSSEGSQSQNPEGDINVGRIDSQNLVPGGAAMPPSFQNSTPGGVSVPPSFQNSTHHGVVVSPNFQAVPQNAAVMQTFNSSATPLPQKSDDSDEWQYVDEDDEEEENAFDSSGGVTYSPEMKVGHGKAAEKTSGEADRYGQTGQSAVVSGQIGDTQQPPGIYGQGAQSWSTTKGGAPSLPFNSVGQSQGVGYPYGTQQAVNGQGYYQNGTTVQSTPNTAQAVSLNTTESEAEVRIRKSLTEAEIEKGRFLVYQLISCIFFLLAYTAGATLGIINCVWWFIPEKRGHVLLLILGITAVVFLPLVICKGIGACRSVIGQIKNKKYRDF